MRAPRIKKEAVETRIRTEEARRVPGTQGDTLKVVQNLPGVARAAVKKLRENGARAHRLAGHLLAADVDAAVVRRDGEDAVAQEVAIVAVHGADQPASAAAWRPPRIPPA